MKENSDKSRSSKRVISASKSGSSRRCAVSKQLCFPALIAFDQRLPQTRRNASCSPFKTPALMGVAGHFESHWSNST